MIKLTRTPQGQARAPMTQPFGAEAFAGAAGTTIRWLGGAGALINSRGACLMIDPVLDGFDMPLLAQAPISAGGVPRLDAVLLTHCDADHFSRETCRRLAPVCGAFHAPRYVAGLVEELGIPAEGHDIGAQFDVGAVTVRLTPADHAWQNESPKHKTREFKREDYCGFWLDTPDGSVWAVGDSRLLPEQLAMPRPDAMLFDFSDSSWHIGLEGAVRMAAAYPDTPLILWHWGCVDAPQWKEFNGDPEVLAQRIVNPGRIVVLAPGEPWTLRRLEG